MIREKLQIPVELQKGAHGQFDIMVDGRSIVSRKGGLIAKLVGRPWPESDDVLAAVRAALT